MDLWQAQAEEEERRVILRAASDFVFVSLRDAQAVPKMFQSLV